MNLIKPKKLNYGDTIAIAALSGNLDNSEALDRAVSFLKNKGFDIKLADNIYDKKRYLAGEDDIKLEQLHKMFSDDSINAVFCLRGGYGAIRLVNKIDYDLIRNNPKIFIGYSDVTALSAMFLKKAGMITYSGPMCIGDFGSVDGEKETFDNCFDVLMNDKVLIYEPFQSGLKIAGNAKGITFGGNLATLVSLCGLDFIPNENFIFFAEDLNEPAYKIDKMMTQLLNISDFRKNIRGIVLGEFLDVDNYDWLQEIFTEISCNLNIPVIGNFRITHNNLKITVPYGAKSEIKDGKFIIHN
ncbi:LD-carboxypeptidase [bacterium]|nr:LD-carboxypeptidase [bacterium]